MLNNINIDNNFFSIAGHNSLIDNFIVSRAIRKDALKDRSAETAVVCSGSIFEETRKKQLW